MRGLINRKLQAAHCIPEGKWRLTSVRISEDHAENECEESEGDCSEERNGPDCEVEGWIVHEDYNVSIRYNDIALIRLKTVVKFDQIVKPICLPWPQRSLEENAVYFAAGWSTESLFIFQPQCSQNSFSRMG